MSNTKEKSSIRDQWPMNKCLQNKFWWIWDWSVKRVKNLFVYKKALIWTFHTSFLIWLNNNLCEFTALEHKFQRGFWTKKYQFKTLILKISGIQKKTLCAVDFIYF